MGVYTYFMIIIIVGTAGIVYWFWDVILTRVLSTVTSGFSASISGTWVTFASRWWNWTPFIIIVVALLIYAFTQSSIRDGTRYV